VSDCRATPERSSAACGRNTRVRASAPVGYCRPGAVAPRHLTGGGADLAMAVSAETINRAPAAVCDGTRGLTETEKAPVVPRVRATRAERKVERWTPRLDRGMTLTAPKPDEIPLPGALFHRRPGKAMGRRFFSIAEHRPVILPPARKPCLLVGRRRRAHVALMRRERNVQPYYGRE
jgi:hypothetical protein